MPEENYDWLTRGLEPEVRPEYLAQKRRNEALSAATLAEEDEQRRLIDQLLARGGYNPGALSPELQAKIDARIDELDPDELAGMRSEAEQAAYDAAQRGAQGYQSGGVVRDDEEEARRLAGTAAASALYRQLMDKYGFTWPEEQLIPDFWKERARASLDPLMAQSGGVVPQFGGTNMNGISMTTYPARLLIRRGDMRGSGIGMGRPRNTFPIPTGRPIDRGISIGAPQPPPIHAGFSGPQQPPIDASTMPAYGTWPAPINASTMPAIGPAPGVINASTMPAIGRAQPPIQAWTQPAIGRAHGSTDTVPAMLTPGEGILNTGAMTMPGMRSAVNQANQIGRIRNAFAQGTSNVPEQGISPEAGQAIAAIIAGFTRASQSEPAGYAEGGVIHGFQGGTGRVGGQREIGPGEFVRTDYGPGMPRLGRSPADLNEFTGSYENPLGPNDVAVHPNNPFGLKPGPDEWIKVGDEWKHVADYLNRRLDPRKIDFYHPKQPIQQGGFGGRRGPVFGPGGLHQGGGPVSEGGGTGGGGWGGGGDWGAGGVPGGGGPPPGQVSISAPGMSGPEVMEWAPGFNWKPWLMNRTTEGKDPSQGAATGGIVTEGGVVPGFAEGGVAGRPASWGTGKPTRDLIGMGIGGVSNLVFPGLGFLTSPLARWLTQKIQSGNWSSGSFIPPPNMANKPQGGAPGQTTPPPGAAPPAQGGGGGIERGFEGLGGGGFEPLAGAGVGTIGMGGSLGPVSGYGSQGQFWKPWLMNRTTEGKDPSQGVATGGIVMEGGVVPSFQEGGSVKPIGYTDPIEEAEWQKVIPMLPPNTDVAKLKQSGIDPQAALKLFGSVYGSFQGAGTSPTGYNDLAAGGGA